jgi:hypothetical protein
VCTKRVSQKWDKTAAIYNAQYNLRIHPVWKQTGNKAARIAIITHQVPAGLHEAKTDWKRKIPAQEE